MSDMQIVRPRLAFEREYGQHRNWWVRGDVLSGNAVKVLLHLLSHDHYREVSQIQARTDLGLGESAWRSAKENLMTHGFLIEIRDRYPKGARRANGLQCGGQNRYRLVLLDPEEGTLVALDDAIIEATHPIDLEREMPDREGSTLSRAGEEAALDNQERDEKPLITEHVKIKTPEESALDNQDPFIGREKDLDLDLEFDNPGLGQVREVTAPEQEPQSGFTEAERAGLDERLAAVHPKLTVASLEQHTAGRVQLTDFDLVAVSKQILEANRKPGGVTRPAAYIAKSLAAQPEKWAATGTPYLSAKTAYGDPQVQQSEWQPKSSSARNQPCVDHDWGPAYWPEVERAVCQACDVRRREVDLEWATLEAAIFEGLS